jgi:predicted phosphodiesterase
LIQELCTSDLLFVISDIHANGPSLREIARSIPDHALVTFLGDAVGYYDEPNFVCDFLRDRANYAIAGNHDRYVTGRLAYPLERELKYRIQWTRSQLTPRNLRWLDDLPGELSLKLDKATTLEVSGDIVEFQSLRLAHGSPGDCEQYIYPNTDINFACETGTLLLLGHTHHPMIRRADFGAVLNPGSVGQPRDRNPSSCFASINFGTQSFTFERTAYPFLEYAAALLNKDFDKESVSLLTRLA